MSGFDELEDALHPRKNLVSREVTARQGENYGFGEPDPHEPQLQWSRAPLRQFVDDWLTFVLAPLRAIARLIPKR